MICQLLGVPYDDRAQFREWTELGYSMRMAEKDLVEDAMTNLTAYIEALVTKKLANTDQPAEDLLDELVRAREEGDRLSRDELIAFGFGPHFCLGAQLARIELQESLLALVRRFPRMSLAKPAEALEWRRVLVSGLAELPVNLNE